MKELVKGILAIIAIWGGLTYLSSYSLVSILFYLLFVLPIVAVPIIMLVGATCDAFFSDNKD